MKRGQGVREGTGPEGERGGKNDGKRVGGKGPESSLENSDFWYPFDFSHSLVAFQVFIVHLQLREASRRCTQRAPSA